ncbi:restriction endonuclease subunit S [Mycoplasmopsis felis]|uniref:restriction endonuclease subunit S n=1 Tax=Mycoplasmopsis felis TaxID=33923 RepID=UPI002AFF72EB|nr:restriction endonuclease subunit S [Mycoplasmopsis felis]WQQ05549.1 restriction endonuclease subunit S [Mycoplasmopsis felis]
MKKNLVPRVRFKGFDEEWKEERFGDTIEPYRMKNHNKEKLTSYSISNKFGFVNQKEFFENGGKAIRADKSNSLVVFPNSFAYNPARIDVGSIGLYTKEEKCLVSPIYEVFKTDKKMNDEFLFNWFKTDEFKWIVNKSKEGSVRNTVYLRNISDYLINITSYIEQQKIGKLLDQISNLINLENSKLNKLKQLKENLLQKMFPEGNSKTPRIRFKGFEGEWKEERLEEIGQTYTGLSGKTKKDFGHGNSRYITYLNIFNNPIANLKGLDRIEEDCKQNSVKYGDIFVTTSSEIPEEVGITSIWPFKDKENIYLNSFCFGIRLNNINNYYINFLAYNLRNNELRKDIVLLAQGISRFNISNRRFMKLNILLPNISEQQKIGDFFCKIDTLLDLYNSKLNKLKQIKEALLQKMFV